MSDATTEQPREERIPISVAAAAITAFAMLYVTAGDLHSPNAGQVVALPFLGALFLLTYATRWRLPAGRWFGYVLRGVLFGAILLAVGMPREDASYWYFKKEYTSLAGYLLATEMVVQAWRWRDWSQPPEAIGVAILLTSLIVAAASNTFRHHEVAYFVPVYVSLLIISLRRISKPAKPPQRRAGLVILRALMALAALTFAYAVVSSINRYDYRIIRFAMKYLNRPDVKTEIGLSDAPYLGAVFNPDPSLERVLIIDGSVSDPHLRTMAFDRYEARLWQPAMHDRVFQPIDAAALGAGKSGARATVTLLNDISGLLPAPLDSAGIVSDAAISRDTEAVLQTQDPARDLTYQIIAPPHLAYQGPLCVAPTPRERGTLLTVPPEIDPRVGELARRVAGTGRPILRVFRIAGELRDHHAYSLSFSPTGEPMSDFILNDRAAHCEYFASAMVMMARSAGICARFVTGYYAHEREGNQTVVRGRDAHAWAECWVDGTGWVTVDATPSSGTPDALYQQPSIWRRWGDVIADLPRLIRQQFARISRTFMLIVAGAAVAMALCASFYRYLRDRRKQPTTQWRQYAGPSPDLAAAARRFERAVRRRGLLLLPHRTWRESLGAAPPPFQKFIAEYDILRFGGGGDPHRLGRLLEQIEQEPRDPNP